jgi:hypothetical protein
LCPALAIARAAQLGHSHGLVELGNRAEHLAYQLPAGSRRQVQLPLQLQVLVRGRCEGAGGQAPTIVPPSNRFSNCTSDAARSGEIDRLKGVSRPRAP